MQRRRSAHPPTPNAAPPEQQWKAGFAQPLLNGTSHSHGPRSWETAGVRIEELPSAAASVETVDAIPLYTAEEAFPPPPPPPGPPPGLERMRMPPTIGSREQGATHVTTLTKYYSRRGTTNVEINPNKCLARRLLSFITSTRCALSYLLSGG